MSKTDLSTDWNDTIDRLTSDWPEEVKETDPGRDDPNARHKWMRDMEAVVARLRSKTQRPVEKRAPTTPLPSTASPTGYVKW